MSRARTLSWWSLGLVVVTYGLMIFGASVRVHGAGLACPDWPLCFGEVVPPINFKVGLEFGHRALAGLISLVFVGLGAAIFRDVSLRRRVGPVWGLAAVVLAVQIVLGGLTVWELLAEWTVASHLVTGNTFCASLLLMALTLRELESGQTAGHPGFVTRSPVLAVHRLGVALFTVLVIAQVILGGVVSSSAAGLACGPVWPNCGGSAWFPTFTGPMGLQVTHRLVAYLLAAGGLLMVALSRGRGRFQYVTWVIMGLIGLQVVLGVINVWTRIPVEVTLLHSAVADAIFLATAWMNWEVWRAPLASAAPGEASQPSLAK